MYRSTQANTGQLHVGELRAIAFFSVICGGSDSKASAYNAGDLGSGLGRSPGEGNSNPLHSLFLPGKGTKIEFNLFMLTFLNF